MNNLQSNWKFLLPYLFNCYPILAANNAKIDNKSILS